MTISHGRAGRSVFGTFDVLVDSTLSPADAFAAVTRWPEHGRHVPLTRVAVTRGDPGVGQEFVGRTGIGPLGFDDPMRVVRWEPPDGGPGVCEVVKLGRVVRGGALIEVLPSDGGSVVRWWERAEVGPPLLARLTGVGVHLVGGVVFGAVLRRLLRDAEIRHDVETRRAAGTG